MRSAPVRRTQAERSATTRAALLDATMDCLLERGYGGTTTTEVTRRAGVSPGALLHHFPTKADLLAASVRHLVEIRQREFVEAMARIDPAVDRLDAAIDQLWTAMSGRLFVIWIELWVGARTDPELAAAMRSVEAEFAARSQAIFRDLFPTDEFPDAAFLHLGLRFALAVMDGVALRSLLLEGPDVEVIDTLKDLARQVVTRAR